MYLQVIKSENPIVGQIDVFQASVKYNSLYFFFFLWYWGLNSGPLN